MAETCTAHDHFAPADVDEALRSAGLRRTELRVALLDAFARRRRPQSQKELLEGVSRRGLEGVDRVSIYRNLQQFVATGLIHEVATNAYVPCRHLSDRHAHVLLFCPECERHEEICRASDRALFDGLVGRGGFFAEGSALLVSGRCRRCGPSKS